MNNPEAVDYFRQALIIRRRVGDRVGEATILNNIGFTHQSQGQHTEAFDYYLQALGILKESAPSQECSVVLANIGDNYEARGLHSEALAHYRQSISMMEILREQIGIEELRGLFSASHTSPYQSIVLLLVKLERKTEAYDYIQRAKARALLDHLGSLKLESGDTLNTSKTYEEQMLSDEIATLNAQLRAEKAKPEAEQSQQAIVTLETQLQTRHAAYEDLLLDLKLEDPEYASLVTVATSTLTETQRLLTNTTLVEYYVLSPTQTLAFVVTSDTFHTVTLSVTRDSLSLALSQFFTDTQRTLQGTPGSLSVLYDALVRPLVPYLRTEHLLIAPHDVLHYVPFAALHDGQHYLIEQHSLTLIPSASVLPFIRDKAADNDTEGRVLVLGDSDGSLPSGRREAQAVAALYGVEAYVGNQALEQHIWEQGPEVSLLHLSAHGVYNEHAPLFSQILLAPTAVSDYDGVLEVHEIYNLDLDRADLVVLSACQTNLGERSAGDEIIGLTRAFIYAGAPSVISSLWEVEDAATSELMVAFYGYLREGRPKTEALRQAQLDLLRHPDTAHPYYWAGFVLSGDEGPTVEVAQVKSDGFVLGKHFLVVAAVGGCCCLAPLAMLISILTVFTPRKRSMTSPDDIECDLGR